MGVQRCKGTRDLSPEEMTRFHLIEREFRVSCLMYGYDEVKTPVLEYLHLFTSAGTLTPTMLSKVYSFLDWDGWSGERVVLRPDVTIPVARYFIENVKTQLAKLFYVANVFIFEETGEKTRERWQCGAELIGMGSHLADVELITLALEVLKELGIENVELRLSHAGLIKGLLRKLDLSTDEQDRIFDRILDGDLEAWSWVRAEKPELEKTLAPWLDLKGKSAGFIRNLASHFLQDLPDLKLQLDDFINIAELLQNLGCDCQIDITSVRGFEYYTGMIFQLFVGGEKIGGGGRYDDLIPAMGGGDIPASGFALYVDQLMSLIKPQTQAKTETEKIFIRIESGNLEVLKEGFGIARHLRGAGYVVELDLGGKEIDGRRWKLSIQSKTPRFILNDRTKHKKHEANTTDEIVGLLGC
ncbi:ATP phosphoribosyltransferase regulatory subunit [Chloroflexota bacterium]